MSALLKTLLATAMIAAAFSTCRAASTDDGVAIVTLYAEYCDASQLSPQAMAFAKSWQRAHPDEVAMSRFRLGAVSDDIWPKWCATVEGNKAFSTLRK